LRADAQLRARSADSTLAEELLGIARSQLQAGTGTALDVTRAESQRAGVRAQLIAARSERSRTRLDLLRTLGLPLDAALTLADSLDRMPTTDDTPNGNAATARALANRPDLRAADEQLRAAKQGIKALQAERLPSLSAFGDQGVIGQASNRLLPTYDWGIQISVPLFDGFRREGRIEEQRAVAGEADVRRRDLRAQAEVEVRAALLDLTAAREQVDAARERLRLTEQEVAQTRERFAAGVGRSTRGVLLYDILASPLGFLFAWVYTSKGVAGAFFLAIPLLAVRQLFRTSWQLEQATQDLLQLMVKAIEARDPYTSGHSQRVQEYSVMIGRAYGLSSRTCDRLGTAALLHDVGKIHEIYAPILRKPDKLTPEEWEIMRTHPTKSAELVSTVSHLKDLVDPVRHHHENWDGSGYPHALAGDAIPLWARIITIADTIDAMTTDRPYRKALTVDLVRIELASMAGRQFDPDLCVALLQGPFFSQLAAKLGDAGRPTAPLSIASPRSRSRAQGA
jgi:HD-GYP domain-containing protein (c-di-GMP phosphodiesterase class II)